MTRLLLARHGATEANLRKPYTLQGLLPDAELAPLGIEQARALGQVLASWPISHLYCSPLRRAIETAQFIQEQLPEIPFNLVPQLAEINVGLWTGLTWEEIARRWPVEFQAFQNDAEINGYLGGENLQQVLSRALVAIEEIVTRHPDDTILVVSHGVVNRVLLAHWIGIPLRHARRLPQENTGFNVISFEQRHARVCTINTAEHLSRFAVAA